MELKYFAPALAIALIASGAHADRLNLLDRDMNAIQFAAECESPGKKSVPLMRIEQCTKFVTEAGAALAATRGPACAEAVRTKLKTAPVLDVLYWNAIEEKYQKQKAWGLAQEAIRVALPACR